MSWWRYRICKGNLDSDIFWESSYARSDQKRNGNMLFVFFWSVENILFWALSWFPPNGRNSGWTDALASLQCPRCWPVVKVPGLFQKPVSRLRPTMPGQCYTIVFCPRCSWWKSSMSHIWTWPSREPLDPDSVIKPITKNGCCLPNLLWTSINRLVASDNFKYEQKKAYV